MNTQLGRVVYDRKKNVMRPRDIARILASYSTNLSYGDYGEFVLNTLELTLNKLPNSKEWKEGFWRYLLNSFNRAALEEMFVPERFRTGLTPEGATSPPASAESKIAGGESIVEIKRRKQGGTL